MPSDSKKRALHKTLLDRILTGDGQTPPGLRRQAFDNAVSPGPLRALVGKVATAPTSITDADVVAAKDAGFSEDQIFEVIVCAAIGQANRQYDAGLLALALAMSDGERG